MEVHEVVELNDEDWSDAKDNREHPFAVDVPDTTTNDENDTPDESEVNPASTRKLLN
jgi:hypothetical protein